MKRRTLLRGIGAALGVGAAGTALWATGSRAAGSNYRALVVLVLDGGSDGHNMLVPIDAGYTDYQRSRTSLALAKSSLVTLPGSVDGRRFGLHPALGAMAAAYGERRLAFIANAGPLVQPVTAAQIKEGSATLPMFLMSHYDQIALQQGRDWAVHLTSGWAGRGVELLPHELRNPLAGVDVMGGTVLPRGRLGPAATLRSDYRRGGWPYVHFVDPQDPGNRTLNFVAGSQYRNAYKAQYLRSLQGALDSDSLLNRLVTRAAAPTQDFGNGQLGPRLRQLASLLPVFAAEGYRRQVFGLRWGQLDTHNGQRGSGLLTQDTQFAELAQALTAFDVAVRSAGLGESVTVLMLTDFGRTLRTSSGGGSEHAWGNHLFALGDAVAGGTVHGIFPDLTLGGPDDFDVDQGGRHVPTTSTDQVAASVLRWLGVPAERLGDVFPYLHNFASPTMGLMRA